MNVLVPDLVSAIIPVYNRLKMAREAVASVFAQDYRPIEIILVDDGSEPDCGAGLDALAAQHPSVVRVIHQANSGPGLAREAGRLVARGEFIQYLDSDDLLLPAKFSIQVAALRAAPGAEIAYGKTRRVTMTGVLLDEVSKETGVRRERLFPALLIDRWWHTSTPLYTRHISDAAGSWPAFRPEDWDLEARMGAEDARLVYCDQHVSLHREHDSPDRVTRGRHETYLREEARFLPRLLACARRAGVPPDAPELAHFSRWAFMRARHLGAINEPDLADLVFEASLEAAGPRPPRVLRLAAESRRVVGWRALGLAGKLREAVWKR